MFFELDPFLIILIAVILFFFITLAGLLGSFIAKKDNQTMVGRVERLSKIQEELKDEVTSNQASIGSKQNKKKSLISSIDFTPLITKFTGESYFSRLEMELTRADIPLKVNEFITVRIILIFVSLVLGIAFLKLPWGLFAVLLPLILEKPVIGFRKKSRLKKFTTQLAEFLILIVNSLRAGQTFVQGCMVAAGESPHPISTEFKQMIKEVNLGMEEADAMESLLLRVPTEDLKIVVSGYIIQKRVGGNLAEILETTAATIRDRIRIQGMIDTLTTQGKLSGVIVGMLPFAIGLMVNVINPTYMKPLIETSIGNVIIVLALVMQMIGAFVIKVIVSIKV